MSDYYDYTDRMSRQATPQYKEIYQERPTPTYAPVEHPGGGIGADVGRTTKHRELTPGGAPGKGGKGGESFEVPKEDDPKRDRIWKWLTKKRTGDPGAGPAARDTLQYLRDTARMGGEAVDRDLAHLGTSISNWWNGTGGTGVDPNAPGGYEVVTADGETRYVAPGTQEFDPRTGKFYRDWGGSERRTPSPWRDWAIHQLPQSVQDMIGGRHGREVYDENTGTWSPAPSEPGTDPAHPLRGRHPGYPGYPGGYPGGGGGFPGGFPGGMMPPFMRGRHGMRGMGGPRGMPPFMRMLQGLMGGGAGMHGGFGEGWDPQNTFGGPGGDDMGGGEAAEPRPAVAPGGEPAGTPSAGPAVAAGAPATTAAAGGAAPASGARPAGARPTGGAVPQSAPGRAAGAPSPAAVPPAIADPAAAWARGARANPFTGARGGVEGDAADLAEANRLSALEGAPDPSAAPGGARGDLGLIFPPGSAGASPATATPSGLPDLPVQAVMRSQPMGTNTMPTPGYSPYLRNERSKFAEEYARNPRLRLIAAAMMESENARDPLGPMESLANRAAMTGRSLESMLSPAFYGPMRHRSFQASMARLARNPRMLQHYDTIARQVFGGSNVLGGATDQGSGHDPNVGWSGGRIRRSGEIYNDWGGFRGHDYSRRWRENQQRNVRAGLG